jgi:hypothetical protein
MAISYVFNVFTGTFDAVDGSGSYWLNPVATFASLPLTDANGASRIVLDEDALYTFDSGSGDWIFAGKVKTAAAGSSPNANGYSVADNNTLTLQPADATNPGIVSTASQTIAGDKTFPDSILADGGIDVTATVGSDTLAIGTGNANVINIGNSGATINIQGTTNYEDVDQLQVTDPLITLNRGGGAGSASNSGIELEENSVITAYCETSANRNSWILKAPNTAGEATITPGAGGITLDQSSHNPVTLGAVGSSPNGNAASLSTQVLTLQPADATNPGVITADVQTIGGNKTFNGSISASNLSGTNTGDVTLTAVGASPNSNGASLSGQALTLQPADATNPGVITTGSQTLAGVKTFNSAPLLNSLTASTAVALDGSKNIVSSATTATELGYVNGVTSSIQTQLNNRLLKASGDINETSFSAANNVAVATDVTGLAFANASVRSFEALVSVVVDADSDLYEHFSLKGIQRAADWVMSATSVGDSSGFVFTITNAGQIQYTNNNYTGFVSATVKFRALSTSV